MATINIPGVPPLLQPVSGFIRSPDFLRSDAIPLISSNNAPQWGVYKNGQLVIQFETFVGIDFRQGYAIADFPLEPNAFESYDKVELPFDARIRFASGGSEEVRQALLDSVAAAAKSLDKYTIVTPEVVYRNVNIQHYDYRRTATNGAGVIQVELWFLEIREAQQTGVVLSGNQPTDGTATSDIASIPTTGGAPAITYARDPSGVSAFNTGFVQAQVPTQQLQSSVSSFNDRFFFNAGTP